MSIKVGITGGIGSGKTFVCNILEKMGYPVYYSDKESKRLTAENQIIRNGLIDLLGDEVFLNDELNKSFLANKIFNNSVILEQVNQLIHPIVRQYFNQWAESQKSPFVFNEAAILLETGSYKTLDFNVLVTANENVRIQRTMLRDSISREEVLARISKQWDDEKKKKLVDFIIINDGEMPLLEQLNELESKLLQLKNGIN